MVHHTGNPIPPIPACAGIGLRSAHHQEVVERRPTVGFFEVHSENFFGAGGPPHRYLERVRAEYPLSLHGVGMSLGSVDPLNNQHLDRLAQLIERYRPGLVSDHLSWCSIGERYFNDLLPMPYTEEALAHVVFRVCQVQEHLGRQILVENVSTYLEFEHSTIPEWEFVAEVAQQSGCGVLLDVNNVYVNAVNHGFDPQTFLRGIPLGAVGEMHLAGHTVNHLDDGKRILIDTHNDLVCDPVWELFRVAVARFGRAPTLIEWDTDLPELDVLLNEAAIAQMILEQSDARVA